MRSPAGTFPVLGRLCPGDREITGIYQTQELESEVLGMGSFTDCARNPRSLDCLDHSGMKREW